MTTERDNKDELDRWADLINRRGIFARDTKEDLKIVECGTAREWARSMKYEFGVVIDNVTSNPNDPPDCIATYRGRTISIELTELVNSELLHRIAQAKKEGCRKTTADELFDAAQWSPRALRAAIDRLLDNKEGQYVKSASVVDVLVLHTDEHWLSVETIRQTLADWSPAVRKNIGNAYLLGFYVPGYAEHWPLFKLYGTFPN